MWEVMLGIIQPRPIWRITQCVTVAALVALLSHVSIATAQDIRIIDRFAGGSNGDTGPATGASMRPLGTAIDGQGNVYFADVQSNSVRRIAAATGIITTVAGNGEEGDNGLGGPAIHATFRGPSDVDIDSAGNLYIVDRGNHKIKRVAAATGIIQTVAGNGSAGYSGDGGPATSAKLYNPTSVAVEDDGTFFIADTTNERIRQVFPGGGIRTIAGTGVSGFTGDGGPASNARIGRPWGIGVDSDGNIYFAELLNQRIRMVVRATETIHTFAGTGQFAFCDNVPRLNACFKNPTNVDYDPVADALYVGDSGNQRIRKVPLGSGNVSTVAGSGFIGFSGDGGPATQGRFNGPGGIAVHPNFGIYVADEANFRIRHVSTHAVPLLSTYAGNGNEQHGGDGGPATAGKLNGPVALRADEFGNLYIADTLNQRIRKVDSAGTISTVAGTGDSGFSGDGGPATSAKLTSPAGVAADRNGNVYFSDTSNNRVRRVAPNGIVTTLFGTGQATSTGDNGPAAAATVIRPSGLSVFENAAGTQRYLYVTEPASQKIRRVDLNTNTVIRFAGTGSRGSAGDGGLATGAQLSTPLDVATDSLGNVYIADGGNHKIRKVAAGIITTLAGDGVFRYGGDGGLAISASLALPDGVAVDPQGNVFINDSANLRIRVVTLDGKIHTAAGTGVPTGSIDGDGGNPIDDLGDGGPATSASFSQGTAIAIDPVGNAFIADNTPSHTKDTIRWVEDIATLYGGPLPQGSVSGTVRHAITQGPVPAVTVHVMGPTNDSESTSSSGSYTASALPLATWLVEPAKQAGFGSGAISPLDASYVLQYLVNSRDLTVAQRLACDVTGDGDLSALDATRIIQRSLGSQTPFPAAATCESDWLFIPSAAASQNQTQLQPLLGGGTTCRMGAVQFSPLAGQPTGQDFLGVVLGDCTGNWNSGSGGATSSLSRTGRSGASTVTVGPERRNRTRLRVPFSVAGAKGFNAMEARIGFDPDVLRPVGVVTRGAARDAIMSWQTTDRGLLVLALASGKQIPAPANSVVVVDFQILSEDRRPAILSAQVRLDESDVSVRLARRTKRR
jgi:sugar lactone lactonase YvrE